MHFVDLIGRALVAAGMGPVRLVTTEVALSHESTKAAISSGIFSAIGTIDTSRHPALFPYRLHEPVARQYRDTMGLAQYIQSEGGSERFRLVFLPFLDSASIAPLAIGNSYPFGHIPFAGLVIKPSYHQRKMGVPSRWRFKDIPEQFFYSRILANPFLIGLFSIDPYFVRYHSGKSVAYTPDPAAFIGTPAPNALRRRLGIPSNAIVLLVYGHIDERKGLAQLINAVTGLDPGSPVIVLVCGRQTREIVTLLKGKEAEDLRLCARLFELNRYLSAEEEYEAFLASDIVWVCYDNRYANSSGAMIRAGQAGLPIISSRYGLTGKMTDDHCVGISTGAGDIAQITDTIRLLASNAVLRRSLGTNGLNLFSQHTPEAFVAPIVQQLRSKLPEEDFGDSERPTVGLIDTAGHQLS